MTVWDAFSQRNLATSQTALSEPRSEPLRPEGNLSQAPDLAGLWSNVCQEQKERNPGQLCPDNWRPSVGRELN